MGKTKANTTKAKRTTKAEKESEDRTEAKDKDKLEAKSNVRTETKGKYKPEDKSQPEINRKKIASDEKCHKKCEESALP